MTSPVAAEQFARQLVADEISTILADATVERWVNQDEVDAVLDQRFADPCDRQLAVNRTGSKAIVVARDAARAVLSQTKDGSDKACDRPWDDIYSLTGLFDTSGDKSVAASRASEADEEFTILTTYSRRHVNGTHAGLNPELGLGTLLERYGAYWLCMQPLCDGARLDHGAPARFPLLPLDIVGSDRDFDLVVPGVAPRVRLKLVVKLNRLVMPEFLPGGRGAVIAIQQPNGDRYVYPIADVDIPVDRDVDGDVGGGGKAPPAGSRDTGLPYRWLGQLRLDQAHRFAALLGNSAGRIGLDEPEWSRRRAGRS